MIVLLENGAAMAGLIIAAAGLALAQATGNPHWDGIASIAIGLLLGAVAIFLAREAKGLLIGEAADPALEAALRDAAIRSGVMRVGEMMTVHNAPDQIVAAMSVDFDNRIGAGDVERIVAEIEADVRATLPQVVRLFIRPMEIAPEDAIRS